jgi:hypothetical protein
MGCDIHFHIEVKINGVWQHYGAPDIARNYELFNVLAGVRGSGKPIVSPKGLPDDASDITKIDYAKWGRDAHTPSWLNYKEIVKLENWLMKKKKENSEEFSYEYFDLEYSILKSYLFGNAFTSYKEHSEIEDVRFVFWFDN